MKRTPLLSIGDLRSALDNIPKGCDDHPIYAQVIAKDGTAWNMTLDLSNINPINGIMLSMSHHQLETMPKNVIGVRNKPSTIAFEDRDYTKADLIELMENIDDNEIVFSLSSS